MQRLFNHPATAILLPAVAGLLGGVLSVRQFEQYGWSLFLGLPVVVSFLAAFFWNYGRRKTFAGTYGLACLSLLALGGLILVFALDGLVCLLMALPLALVLALGGAALGRWVGCILGNRAGASMASVLCLGFPWLVAFEHASARGSGPAMREVTTSVWIVAPIGDVWTTVVAFPPITDPPRGLFRLGIAYPIEARIEGHGAGAVRYCTFSTGSFVEPITEWNEPVRLTFDVVENPPPMREISFHEDLDAPHLHGHLSSRRGQFRLSEHGDRVLLEGTTWYTNAIAPEFYWGAVSDAIIHRIHLRVLNHIKRHAEANQAVHSRPPGVQRGSPGP